MKSAIEFFRGAILDIIHTQLLNNDYNLPQSIQTSFNMQLGKCCKNSVLKNLELDEHSNNKINLKNLNVEISLQHADIATNAAMILASQLQNSAVNIAQKLIPYIQNLEYVKTVDFVKPGFINIKLDNEYWYKHLLDILTLGSQYGNSNLGQNKKINLEFVSANPTGPLHIGHMRNAIYGDVIANMLVKCGYAVTREFYINDLGTQIEKVVQSVYLRYQEALGVKIITIPEGMYPGTYLIDVAKHIIALDGKHWLQKESTAWKKKFQQITIDYLMQEIKQDLQSIGVSHDVFTKESDLHKNHALLEQAINKLNENKLIYTGQLEAPISRNIKQWQVRKNLQLLVKMTQIGGDKDCALYKANGEWSYFASDLSYIMFKFQRGYKLALYILGSEQSDYIKRLEKLCYYLTDNQMQVHGVLYQMVGLIKDNKPLKLSKRSGNLISIKEILQELDKDTLRFMMLSYKSDMPIKLDINKLKIQNKDNPIFYTKYAYARAQSLIKIARAHFPYLELSNWSQAKLVLLILPEELNLIKYLAQWPTVVTASTAHLDPQRLILFLGGMATLFHSLWTKGKSNNKYRFIVEDNLELTKAKLALVQGVIYVIESCAQIISIDLQNYM